MKGHSLDNMKVLLLSYGPEDYSIEFANAVSALCDVTMFAPRRLMANLEQYASPSLALRLFVWPRQSSFRSIGAVLEIVREIRSLRPTIIHNLNEAYVWVRLVRALTKRYPLVTTVHDLSYRPGEPIARKLPRWMVDLNARASDAIVVHGSAMYEGAQRSEIIPAEKLYQFQHLTITRYRMIADRDNLSSICDDNFRVLFFGRIHKYKGLDYLISAANEVVTDLPNVKFTVAGKGDDISALRAIAKPGSVEFIDRFIPDNEVAQLFLDADVVVLPYTAASQSGVLALAASFGKPAIVTRTGGLPEMIEAGDMGVIVPPADVEALANAIRTLATNSATCARLGQNAKYFADSSISHRVIGEQAMEVYRAVIESAVPR